MNTELNRLVILVKGGGEVASAVAHKLFRAHFRVCMTEIAEPVAVSRGVAFCEAIFDGKKEVEGVVAKLANSAEDIHQIWAENKLPIMVDPEASIKNKIKPDVLIDAIMAKRNLNTKITDAPLVIGLGPGFYAGRDVHIVVETNHSNNLGKVILEGEAEENTGTPVAIGGLTKERVIWAPEAGTFTSAKEIGDSVVADEVVGYVENLPLKAPLNGMLRGILRSSVKVPKGAKLIEVDSVHDSTICNFITDKMRAISEGVVKAIMLKFDPDF